MKRNKMKCNETWDKSINEKHRHNLLFLKKQKTNFKRREILVVDHFSLFVCLLFRFETRDSGKDEWPKKKLNGQQNTLRDIRPSLIRQNKPPLLLSAQDLCFFSFLSSSLQRRAQQLILSIYKDLLVGLSVFRYTKCERLNFDAIGTKAGTLRCVARSFWDEQKRERDPLLHLYCVSSG